jgi:hypothetical protein
MSTLRRHLAIAVLAVVALTTAGCDALAPVASLIPVAGPLVTVTTRGGECVDGPCGQTVMLERDGRVHAAAKPPNDLGVVPEDQVRAVAAAIAATDFAAMRAHPFTGECPTAFDGQETVFEFATATGTVSLASCEVELDLGQPVFVAVATALGPFIPLPTT